MRVLEKSLSEVPAALRMRSRHRCGSPSASLSYHSGTISTSTRR